MPAANIDIDAALKEAEEQYSARNPKSATLYEAAERLAHEGVAPEDVVMQRTVDMMYQGQWRSLAASLQRAARMPPTR